MSERLEFLFKAYKHPDGREYTQEEVAAFVEAQGYSCSYKYVSQLRRGERRNPKWDVLRPIAQFFGVGVEVFDDPSPLYEEMKRQYELGGEVDVQAAKTNAAIAQLSDQQQVLLRTVGDLSQVDLKRILAAMDAHIPPPPRFQEPPNPRQ